ncbi:MAG: hypothetical protein LUH57_03690 [Ruminococcus sp.]|nr:hypothetical protein [Ruminococcus sp.]
MLFKSIRSQMHLLFQQKITVFFFFAMLAVVVANFIYNVVLCYGAYSVKMYNPMYLSVLNYQGRTGMEATYFSQCFPLLVVIPAAFSYVKDRNSGEEIYIQTRFGRRNYFYGKFFATFITTFIIFAIPFLIEIALNCIAFPLSAERMMAMSDFKVEEYAGRFLFSTLYFKNEYVYSVFFVLLFGVASGIFASFSYAFSTFRFMKFKLLVFIPLYFVMFLLSVLGDFLKLSYNTYYGSYFKLYDSSEGKTLPGYLIVLAVLLIVTLIIIEKRSREDCLN